MKTLYITDIDLFGLTLVTDKVLKNYKTYKLNLDAALPEKNINTSLKIMIFDMTAKSDKGFVNCRAGFRRLRNSQITALKELTEYFSDSEKKETIHDLVSVKIG